VTHVKVGNDTKFSDVYQNLSKKDLGSGKHVRYDTGQQQLYKHSALFSRIGSAATLERQQKWSGGAAQIKQLIANEHGQDFADRVFANVRQQKGLGNIDSGLRWKDLSRVKAEIDNQVKLAGQDGAVATDQVGSPSPLKATTVAVPDTPPASLNLPAEMPTAAEKSLALEVPTMSDSAEPKLTGSSHALSGSSPKQMFVGAVGVVRAAVELRDRGERRILNNNPELAPFKDDPVFGFMKPSAIIDNAQEFDRAAAVAKGMRNIAAFPENHGLNPLEKAALYSYTRGTYDPVNKALWAAKGGPIADQGIASFVDHMVAGLKKLPDTDARHVTRGVSDEDGEIRKKYVVGAEVTETAFTSTSRTTGFNGDLQYIILPKRGKDVAAVSNVPKEGEVLFAPGSQFRVLHREDRDASAKGQPPQPATLPGDRRLPDEGPQPMPVWTTLVVIEEL
jgi:hypothetical protein